jgi:hypothetical protein
MFVTVTCIFHSHRCAYSFFFGSSGLTFKKLDKRLERTMLHSYRKVCFLLSGLHNRVQRTGLNQLVPCKPVPEQVSKF